MSIHVMEHVEDDHAFLRQCLDKVSTSGHVVMLVPALNALYSDHDRKIGHFRRYDRPMIRRLAERANATLVLNCCDNMLGVLGWYWICKVRGIDYQSPQNKKVLKGSVGFFSNHVLPVVPRLEKHVSPPVGLNLTAVFRKRTLPQS